MVEEIHSSFIVIRNKASLRKQICSKYLDFSETLFVWFTSGLPLLLLSTLYTRCKTLIIYKMLESASFASSFQKWAFPWSHYNRIKELGIYITCIYHDGRVYWGWKRKKSIHSRINSSGSVLEHLERERKLSFCVEQMELHLLFQDRKSFVDIIWHLERGSQYLSLLSNFFTFLFHILYLIK